MIYLAIKLTDILKTNDSFTYICCLYTNYLCQTKSKICFYLNILCLIKKNLYKDILL